MTPENIKATIAHPVEFKSFNLSIFSLSTACLILLRRTNTKIVGIAKTKITIMPGIIAVNAAAPTSGEYKRC